MPIDTEAKAKEDTLKHRTHRLRRLASAAVLGVGMTAGVIGVTAGTAGALTTPKISATAATHVNSTGTTQPGANMKVTLAGSTARASKTVVLTAATTGGSAVFKTLTATGNTVTVNSSAVTAGTHKKWNVTVTTAATKVTQFITFTAVKYTTSAATGSVKVTPSGTATAGPFVGSPVTDATVTAASGNNTITATSKPTIATNGVGQTAGSLKVKLHNATGAAATNSKLKLTATVPSGTVDWSAAPTVTCTGCTAATATAPVGNAETITISVPAGTTATVSVTNVKYNTAAAVGTVTVTPTWKTSATTSTLGTFTPSSAVNAVATHATPSTRATTPILVATATLPVGKGTNGQAAGTWTVVLKGAKTHGWTATQKVHITVFLPTSHTSNCVSSVKYVTLTGTPKVTASGTGTSTTPTVTYTASGTGGHCTATSHNEVNIKFTNSGTFTKNTGEIVLAVSGVKYNVGKTTGTGDVSVAGALTGTAAFTHSTTAAPAGPSNAKVTLIYVTANTPSVTMTKTAFNQKISPVVIHETAPGQVTSPGYVCVSLTPTNGTSQNVFNTSGAPTAKVVKGTGKVTSKVTYEKTSGVAATTTATAKYARFKVTSASTKTASTYEFTGLTVNAGPTAGTETAKVHEVGSATNCNAGGKSLGTAAAYAIKVPTQQIYGATADATAAKILETAFPATGTAKCVGGHANASNTRPVIMATDQHFQDALASQYLAGYLDTGLLVNPGRVPGVTPLPSVVKNALRTEGVTQVYLMGGDLAESTTAMNALETTPAYNCGGTSVLTTGGKTRYITVTRIGGQTATDTAELVATTPPSSHVKSASFTGAYVGVNTTKGNGKYNDTAGTASAAPSTGAAIPTAILSSSKEFQDAMASAPMAWETSFPVLLTGPTTLSTAAKSGIENLGIRQVVLMGGQLAIYNKVVTQLEALGVSVVRVAGKTYGDTSVQLAKFLVNTVTNGRNWWTNAGGNNTVTVTRGNGFTDGMAGAVYAGSNHEPLLLTTNPQTVGAALTAFLKASGQKDSTHGIDTRGAAWEIKTLVVFGGPLSVTPTEINKMETDIG